MQAFDRWSRGKACAHLPDAWGKTMVDMVNSEATRKPRSGIDTYLTVSAPFREAVEKAMLKTSSTGNAVAADVVRSPDV